MPLKNEILSAQKQALKDRDADKVSILRLLLAAVKNVEIDKRKELIDTEVEEVIRRQVKQFKDALADFERGGRPDLVERARAEIALLSSYLPAEPSDEDLRTKIQSILDVLDSKERLNAGQAMGAVMKELKGQADGGRVREILTKILNSEQK